MSKNRLPNNEKRNEIQLLELKIADAERRLGQHVSSEVLVAMEQNICNMEISPYMKAQTKLIAEWTSKINDLEGATNDKGE